MGFFKKLFTADPAALEDKADALFADGDFGPAKLAYEKALDATDAAKRQDLEGKIAQCMDGIARDRIKEAKDYLARREIALASDELHGALEVAASNALVAEAQGLLDNLEAEDAVEQAGTEEMTDEERLAVIAGHWEEAQADEYETYGQPLFDALVQMQAGQVSSARTALEELVGAAAEPRYLWLEVGRARLLSEDSAGAKDAIERFIGALADDEGGETKLAAYFALARLADDEGDFEGATDHFESAVASMPSDYRPYLAMGSFLRGKGHAAEAVEVLKTAQELSKSAALDWRLLEELGLAQEAIGETEEAVKFFEQVVEFFAQRQETDLPPATATNLARLYEDAGKRDRAADLYRALSQGLDRENHGRYHFEAGRLLRAIGLEEEAHRMLTRAQALASDDEELAREVAALLQQ
ncbi:MAG: tetratricopeptide repeat protein [Myxococcota bacterium]